MDSDAPSSATTNASLSDMGMNNWTPHPFMDAHGQPMADHHAAASYHQQPIPSQEFYDHSMYHPAVLHAVLRSTFSPN